MNVNTRMPIGLVAHMKMQADKEGITLSELVRKAMYEYLMRNWVEGKE